jgi:hypothetical protein
LKSSFTFFSSSNVDLRQSKRCESLSFYFDSPFVISTINVISNYSFVLSTVTVISTKGRNLDV